ncbi:flagellar filament capping protein FliD [Kineococcus sp. SYSU DK003]|uniref:flagellar filament capping protein FliD n=1 Tax=Kineococcus sp. SYSU DK003 TaxID=3383124 RepID=UPI003D7F1031
MSTTVSSSTVDGLISGLDTTSIISQLLSVDAAAQTKLQAKVTTANAKVAAYQAVNTKLVAVQTAADALQKASAWSPTTSSSSSTAVTVAASASASAGSVTFTVNQLAAGKTVVTPPITAGSDGKIDPSAIGAPMDIVRSDGTYVTVNPSRGTLSEMVDAINSAANAGVKAVALRVADGSYRLQITSTGTGVSAGDFHIVDHGSRATGDGSTTKISGFNSLTDGSKFTTVTSAVDAKITLPGSVEVTSASNTFTEIMPGVGVTVTAPASSVSVSVVANPSAIADALQSLVDATNAALSAIGTHSKAGVVSSSGTLTGAGALSGDNTLRALKSDLLTSVTAALGGTTSAATFGLQSTSDGQLKFDSSKFLSTYAADPSGTQKLVSATAADATNRTTTAAATPGVVERLRKVTVSAIGDLVANPTTASGSLTLAVDGQESTIDDLTDRIAEWDVRLAAKKVRYQKYYASLEVALGKLQSQSTWLSGQLASLSNSNS